MSLPKYPQKHGLPSMFTARELVERLPEAERTKAPESIVICFQAHTLRSLAGARRGKRLPFPSGELYSLRETGGAVGAVGNFGIGAPAAVFALEWLAALGSRRFIAVGMAGGLHEDAAAGDLMVCSRALRDEGTSYHYLPPGDFAEPDAELTRHLSDRLNKLGYAHSVGPAWTTDAPLRETSAEILHWRSLGILAVDMEAAALFAASQALGLACAAAFAIADSPRDGGWQLDFDRNALRRGLEQLARAAVRTLAP